MKKPRREFHTVLTMTRARESDSVNRQNAAAAAGLLSLSPSRYPSFTKHQ